MVILINPFQVIAEREAEFLALWEQTGEIFSRSDGYISARLCRALAQQAASQIAPYTHVNIAEWETAALYHKALMHPDIRRLGPAYKEVSTFDPALYEIIRDLPRA